MKSHYTKMFSFLSFFFVFSASQSNSLAADNENATSALSAVYLLLLSDSTTTDSTSSTCISSTLDSSTLEIEYNGDSVTVTNPYEDSAVSVAVAGADVTVTSACSGIEYSLTGITSDGMFKIYSESDFTLQLNGVEITNSDGPAINIQSSQTASIELMSGTSSTLTDGATYAEAVDDEDQKGAFFSEGQLVFSGAGALYIEGQGDDQHALVSDDQIVVNSGTISITDSVKDGIHTNDGYSQQSGEVYIISGGDGIDGGDGPVEVAGGTLTVQIEEDDNAGIKSDGELEISGGTVDLSINGNQSKGLKADGDVYLTGGTVTIQTTGDVVLEEFGSGYDPSYCIAITTDSDVELDGADVSINTTGEAGRGISADGDVRILSGQLAITSTGNGGTYYDELNEEDSYQGPCIKVDGSLTIEDGTVTLRHSGSGGRGISVDTDLTIGTETFSPTVAVTTGGEEIELVSGDATEAKAIKVDNQITIYNGDITIDSVDDGIKVDNLITIDGGYLAVTSADDGIKSENSIEINGGVIDILDAVEGIEAINLVINDGEIHITTSDDGINTTIGGETESDDDGSELVVNGGYIYISSLAGDCIDSNGTLDINGGTIILHGKPSIQPYDGSLDANGAITITGGFLVAAEVSSQVSEVPTTSTQNTLVLEYSSNSSSDGVLPGGPPGGGLPGSTSGVIEAGTLVHVQDSAGNYLFTFAPEREYSRIIFSSSGLSTDTVYQVYSGGSYSGGIGEDGLYTGGTYSGGSQSTPFTSTGDVQVVPFE